MPNERTGLPLPMQAHRQLGLLSATTLVVASMIGTGVFTTSGFLLAELGAPALVLAAWFVGGALAALGALCYGALAREIPESGGEYIFLSRTLHPVAGYLAGWISVLVGFSAPLAATAYAFGQYIQPWLDGVPPKLAGSAVAVLFALQHAIGVRWGAAVQSVIVLIKMGLIAALSGFGLAQVELVQLVGPIKFELGSFAVALVWVSFSYSGWNAAVYIGGEVADPQNNLPRALLLGTALVTAAYLAVNAVFVLSAPVPELAGKLEIARIAASALGGHAWAQITTGLILLALLSSISAIVMAGPRVWAKMAGDGYLPQWLGQHRGPPRAAIAVQLVLALGMLWTATFEALLTYIGFTLSLSTAATVTGLIRLRLRRGPTMRVTGWPWVPLLFLTGTAATCGFTIAQRPAESILGLGTVALGVVAWRLKRKNGGRHYSR
ncbi:MAG: amino acid permease [Verrucomicrobiae bacterium]|nr:amino acid permease [Verrucomicrobiae bacterium]